MRRRDRFHGWLVRQARRVTWPWIVSRSGLAGLVFMLFHPEAATPALVVAFAAMVGIKPMADLDRILGKRGKNEPDA